jgi:hypothetical protein
MVTPLFLAYSQREELGREEKKTQKGAKVGKTTMRTHTVKK